MARAAEADLSVTREDLRSLYENAVLGLRTLVAAMRREGASAEEIARTVHAKRRRLAAFFKQRTPEPLRSQIYSRTLSVYGDPIGPTIERLRARGKSWDDIIDSATRPGPLPSLGPAG
jgi:ribosomal protein S15P/S13E